MRVIHALDGDRPSERGVRSAVPSPGGQYVAAASEKKLAVLDWVSGECLAEVPYLLDAGSPAFTTDGKSIVFVSGGLIYRVDLTTNTANQLAGDFTTGGQFARGIAVSPDGKTLVATRAGQQQDVKLERWELPAWRPLSGFDFWSPFSQLAFSPSGEFLAGINGEVFELRIAVTGGLNGRHRLRSAFRSGFFAFPRDGLTAVFGWDAEFWIMETRNGNVLRRIASPNNRAILGAAFTGSGRQLATVDGSPILRLWSAESWQVIREYDWAAGGLTCVAVTTDGLAGVCGTETGSLVAFDVDE